jgi:hypothetical protein
MRKKAAINFVIMNVAALVKNSLAVELVQWQQQLWGVVHCTSPSVSWSQNLDHTMRR